MRDIVKLDDYVVIDTETTGLSSTDRILEIAAAKIVNHSIVATYTQLINPGMPIPSFITSLTGISDAMVAEAPSIETALPEFLSFCEDLPAVGHNIGFDLGMIRRSCEFTGIECTLSMLDIMRTLMYICTRNDTKRSDIMVNSVTKARKMLGLTQNELASRSGVSRSTIARIETSNSCPNLRTVQKLAVVLGCTIDDLLTSDDKREG